MIDGSPRQRGDALLHRAQHEHPTPSPNELPPEPKPPHPSPEPRLPHPSPDPKEVTKEPRTPHPRDPKPSHPSRMLVATCHRERGAMR
jgi:hypothetical protein